MSNPWNQHDTNKFATKPKRPWWHYAVAAAALIALGGWLF